MATVRNSSTITLQATSPRIEPVPLPGTFFIPGTTLINGSSAATLEANANNAIAIANAANAQLTSIASDSILSSGEKPAVKLDYDAIIAEQSSLNTQALTFGITTERTNYNSAVTALTNYLGTLTGWDTIPGTDVAIVGTTFRLNFYNVYNTKQILLNKLAAVAATQAAWSGVTGTGKPADFATVGATWNVNLSSQPTALSGINATEGTKLSGIAAGATVGADFSTNLSNKPTTVGGYSTAFGASAFSGTITGTAGINISGTANFTGGFTDSGGVNVAIAATHSNAGSAISARQSGAGNAVLGISTNASGNGVSGSAPAGAYGVLAQNPSGVALYLNGRMEINNSTLVTNLNAQYLNGILGTQYARYTKGNNGAFTTALAANDALSILFDSTMSGTYRTYASGANLYIGTIASDERLKKNIKEEALGLDFVDKLKARSFNMRKGNTTRLEHGFIAQEVRELFNDYDEDAICITTEDGTKIVSYTPLISVLAKAIQELYTIVKTQNVEIIQLKSQLDWKTK